MAVLLKTDKTIIKKLHLNINEIFFSLQGEGSYSGTPTIFIRLAGCNLRCRWCDTKYAYDNKSRYSIEEIIYSIDRHPSAMISITGGEPLVQADPLLKLIEKLHHLKKQILLETNGSLPIKKIPEYVHIAMDLKAPSSGVASLNNFQNLKFLKATDEVKIIIDSYEDFLWAQDTLNLYGSKSFPKKIYLQPVFDKLSTRELAEWIINSKYPFSLSVQLHKTSFGNKLK